MKTQYEVENILMHIMENDHEVCNSDDMTIYYKFVIAVNPDIERMRFSTVMQNRATLGLPALGSVSRAKRKIFEKREDLRPNEMVEKIHRERAEEMADYAKSI